PRVRAERLRHRRAGHDAERPEPGHRRLAGARAAVRRAQSGRTGRGGAARSRTTRAGTGPGCPAFVSVLVGILVGAVTAWFLRIAGREMLESPPLERSNYRGHPLPTAGGIIIVLALLVIEAGRAIAGAVGIGDEPGLTLSRSLVLFAVFGFGFLGFVDDLLGASGDRGFRGHVRALAQGRLTTGFVKLFGGAGVAGVLVPGPRLAAGEAGANA